MQKSIDTIFFFIYNWYKSFIKRFSKGDDIMKKSILALLGILILSLLLVGCGGKTTDEKVLKVGTNPDFPPFEFTEDGKTDAYKGFDIDLVNAIGKEIDYKVEIKSINFDGLIPALQSKDIDIIASGMTITQERQKSVTFSSPYYTSGLSILVPANSDIKSFGDLEGKKIAVQIGTSSQEEASKVKNATVQPLNSSVDVFMELQAGHTDAVINDRPVTLYYLKETGKDNVKILDEILQSQQYGFAMRKDDEELVQKVNAALKTLKENGEYAKLYEKWFGTAPSQEELNNL